MTSTPVEPRAPAVGHGPAAPPAPWAAAVAGAAAVALMLGLLELVAGLVASVPSLVASVGEFFIPFTPEWLKDWAIATFGTTDKAVLMGVVVAVSLLLGAVVGRVGARSPGLPPGAFLAVGVFGVATALQTPGTGLGATAVAVLAAVALGVASLQLALRHAPRAGAHGDGVGGAGGAPVAMEGLALGEPLGRRPFLAVAAVAAVAAAGAGSAGRALVRRRSTQVAARTRPLPTPTASTPSVTAVNQLDVPGLTPVVVPSEDFYRIDTALQVPLVDASTWQLRIHGMVDTELVLTYEDLLERELVERYVTLSCVSNTVGGDLVGNARWRGTLLGPLLEEAGLQPGATQVVGRSLDGWTAGFPTEVALDGRDAMVAVGMNGEPLPALHGYPARLVVPGLYGYVSATKWLADIEVTTWEGFDGYWVPRGWSKLGPVKTQSRIDVPADGTRVPAGSTVVAGVAWAPDRGVARVEVRVGGGEWVEATTSEPLADAAWVQWMLEVELPEGPSEIQVRATDGTDTTQTETILPPRPDGATGWHTIRVFT